MTRPATTSSTELALGGEPLGKVAHHLAEGRDPGIGGQDAPADLLAHRDGASSRLPPRRHHRVHLALHARPPSRRIVPGACPVHRRGHPRAEGVEQEGRPRLGQQAADVARLVGVPPWRTPRAVRRDALRPLDAPPRTVGVRPGTGRRVEHPRLRGEQVFGDGRLARRRRPEHQDPDRFLRGSGSRCSAPRAVPRAAVRGAGKGLPSAATRAPHQPRRRARSSGRTSCVSPMATTSESGASAPAARSLARLWARCRGSGRPSDPRTSRATPASPAPVSTSSVSSGRSPAPAHHSTVRLPPPRPTTRSGRSCSGPGRATMRTPPASCRSPARSRPGPSGVSMRPSSRVTAPTRRAAAFAGDPDRHATQPHPGIGQGSPALPSTTPTSGVGAAPAAAPCPAPVSMRARVPRARPASEDPALATVLP